MRIENLSIRYKILAIVLIGVVLMTGTIIFRVRGVLVEEAKETALLKARSDLAAGYEILDLNYPGNWRLEGNKLYKGDTLINNNHQIVDKIGELTQGNTATIFAGNTRVATNVKTGAKRAVGTKVSGEVEKEVLINANRFYGEADVVGRKYQAAYQPLKNKNGKVVGIWYVGTSLEFIDNMISSMTFDTAVAILLSSLVLIIVIFIFVLKLTAPLNELSQYADKISAGELNFDIKQKYLDKNDEIGVLAKSFAKMSGSLRSVIKNIDQTVRELSSSSRELTETGLELSASADEVGNSIQQIASGAEEQSAQVEETSSVIDSLNQEIEEIVSSSGLMADRSGEVMENIETGNEALIMSEKSFFEVS